MVRYIPGNPVRGDDFYDRKAQLQTVMEGGWIWVCGQRRIGKTSLLFRLEEEAPKRKMLPLFLDLTTLEEYNGEGLFEMFLLTHGRQLRKYNIRMKDFPLNHPVECFYQLVSDLGEKETEVVFLWDESEKLIEIEQNDPGILNKLRARLCHLRNFRFVISATQLLTELYAQQSELISSFLHTFHWMPLPVLDFEEASALLRCDQAGGWDTPLPEEVIKAAATWSGGHPLIIHELGTLLAERTNYNGKKADSELLHRCFRHLGRNVNLRNIFQDDYAKLTEDQQYLLKRVIDAGGEILLDNIVSTEDPASDKIEDALRFLTNYSYVTWETNDLIRLRFRFYPHLVQLDTQPPSMADQTKVNQIKRTIFIAYSQRDQDSLEVLKRHLTPFIRKGEVEIWNEQHIHATADKERETAYALRRAQVAVLMISPDFLRSPFMSERTIPPLLVKANKKGGRIFCLFVRPCEVDNVTYEFDGGDMTTLTRFQGLNDWQQPLSMLSAAERDETFAKCVQMIVRHIRGTGCLSPVLPPALLVKIAEFLETLSMIHTISGRQTFIYSAGLDETLNNQIHFDGSTSQFCQLLVTVLVKYGQLKDGRDALTAILHATKKFLGQNRQKQCDRLLEELKSFSPSD